MTAIYETAYPRMKSRISAKELVEIYTPTPEEVRFAQNCTNQTGAALGLLTMLKVFQRLGYFLAMPKIPQTIIRHIATGAGLTMAQDFSHYENSSSRYRHLAQIREFVGVIAYGPAARKIAASAMADAANTKDDLADIVNVALEELIRQKYELPVFRTLLIEAKAARATANHNYYQMISALLKIEAEIMIDHFFEIPETASQSSWNLLKHDPGKPTVNNVRAWLAHLDWLRSQSACLPAIKNIPTVKLQKFANEARSLDISSMKQLAYFKRYALATVLIQKQLASALDDLGAMFVKQIQKVHNHAEEALRQYHLQHSGRTESLIALLRNVMVAYKAETSKVARLDAISEVLPQDVAVLIQQCDEYAAYANNNYYAFLPRFYKSRRGLFMAVLENTVLKSTSNDHAMEHAIHFLLEHKNNKKEYLETARFQATHDGNVQFITLLDVTMIPEKWRKWVVRKNDATKLADIHRGYFEICLFSLIVEDLKSGDLCIIGSDEFSDYREQLIAWEDYAATVAAYGKQLGIPVAAPELVAHLQSMLEQTAKRTDAAFPKNEYVHLEADGELVINKPKTPAPPAAVALITTQINQRMKPINILDVLADTSTWINWTRCFGSLSGFETKLDNPETRYLLTTFCYGCNLGPTQTARAMKDITAKQLLWVNLRHVTAEKLEKAIVEVINAYNKFALPKFWGSGKSASADGTKWDVYEANLLSEYHIRYGGYGGIGYYHVSDQYIALFSHFIPCGVYEAIYILDGLIRNLSELQPDTVHGDTHAQSYPVFALAYLLGIHLMPRIRCLKSLTFYRPSRNTKFEHIDPLFTDTINWDLITTHLPDMLRVALSIKAGKIYPSTILRRLGNKSCKDKLYFAFRELGRVIRTNFLLRYLADLELRQTIHAATCKSEEFNDFIQWVFFGENGVIAENQRYEQDKIIKYNHLVANLLILHNVNSMTEVLNELRQEGYHITPEILASISPYRTHCINRYGKYSFDPDRKTDAFHCDLTLV